MSMRKNIVRLVKDDSGMETVEVALSIALIAAVAGFGMVFLGDSLSTWFQGSGNAFAPGTQMPNQTNSTTLG